MLQMRMLVSRTVRFVLLTCTGYWMKKLAGLKDLAIDALKSPEAEQIYSEVEDFVGELKEKGEEESKKLLEEKGPEMKKRLEKLIRELEKGGYEEKAKEVKEIFKDLFK